MAWNYSGDPKTSKLDECRFMSGDTDENEPILQDEEIQYLIDANPTDDDALFYNLFSAMATQFARCIKHSLGPQSEDPTARLDFFKSKMTEYKAKMSAAGLSVPKYAYPKVFHKGMQNNPPWPDKGVWL